MSRSNSVLRTVLAWVTTSLLVAVGSPVSSSAQTSPSERPPEGHRKWLFGAVGGALVGVPAYLSSDLGVGRCNSRNCFAPIAATVGAIAGFLIGAELDNSAARRWVAGPKVDLSGTRHEVPLVADAVVALPEGVVLLGESGLARAGPLGVTSTHAARGVLAAAMLPDHGTLVAATSSALLAFDRDESVRGARRAFGEGGATLAVDGGSRVVLGGEGTLRLLVAEGERSRTTFVESVVATDPDPARAVVWSGPVIWELAGRRLASRATRTLEGLGSTLLPGPGRALAVDGHVGVVAMGESGVAVVDLSDPGLPFVAAVYEGVRYAFDVELANGVAFVTAAEQGLVRLDVSDPTNPTVTGVVGNLGLPYAVVQNGGSLYVLDREDRRLHVIDVSGTGTSAN